MLGKLLLVSFILGIDVISSFDGPTVHVQQGLLQGVYQHSRFGRQFAAFQGIPYAQPPTGNLRFKVCHAVSTDFNFIIKLF
jgi:Carboxylesterase type B